MGRKKKNEGASSDEPKNSTPEADHYASGAESGSDEFDGGDADAIRQGEAIIHNALNPPKKMPMCERCLWQQERREYMLGYHIGGTCSDGYAENFIEQWVTIKMAFPLPFEEFQGRFSHPGSLWNFE